LNRKTCPTLESSAINTPNPELKSIVMVYHINGHSPVINRHIAFAHDRTIDIHQFIPNRNAGGEADEYGRKCKNQGTHEHPEFPALHGLFLLDHRNGFISGDQEICSDTQEQQNESYQLPFQPHLSKSMNTFFAKDT
jgi:hypothetical protein